MKLKYISWIPAVVVMCIIFAFSAKTAVESDGSSLQIVTIFVDLYEKSSGEITDLNKKNEIFLQGNHVVRKMAHATEYAVLAVCVAFHLMACGIKRWKLFLMSVLISASYALTDEIHQYFVEGRSCQITDTLIDTLGATIGAIFFMLLLLLNRYRLKKVTTVNKKI